MVKRLIFFDHFMCNLNPDCRKIVLLGEKIILSRKKTATKILETHILQTHLKKFGGQVLSSCLVHFQWFFFLERWGFQR